MENSLGSTVIVYMCPAGSFMIIVFYAEPQDLSSLPVWHSLSTADSRAIARYYGLQRKHIPAYGFFLSALHLLWLNHIMSSKFHSFDSLDNWLFSFKHEVAKVIYLLYRYAEVIYLLYRYASIRYASIWHLQIQKWRANGKFQTHYSAQ